MLPEIKAPGKPSSANEHKPLRWLRRVTLTVSLPPLLLSFPHPNVAASSGFFPLPSVTLTAVSLSLSSLLTPLTSPRYHKRRGRQDPQSREMSLKLF